MAVEETVLRELSRADVLALGPVGPAATTLPVTRAYQRFIEVIEANAGGGMDVRPHLDRLVAEGSPAGRAYGATLLHRLDPDAGRAAWRSLSADRSVLTTFSGSVMRRTTVAQYAAAQLRVAGPC